MPWTKEEHIEIIPMAESGSCCKVGNMSHNDWEPVKVGSTLCLFTKKWQACRGCRECFANKGKKVLLSP